MNSNCLWSAEKLSVIVSLEPPKGADVSSLLKIGEGLKGRVDGVMISDSHDAIMRMTPLAACHALNSIGLKPIMGLNFRDRNRLAIQGDLLGAWALGITHVIIEEGKDPSYGDHPLTKPVADLDHMDMIKALSNLNMGKDLGGQKLKSPTDFNCGVGIECLDGLSQMEESLRNMENLAKAGAQAFVTSPQFDIEKTKELLEKSKAFGKPVLVTIMLLKSVGMARYLNEVPGISKVPPSVIEKMTKAPVKAKAGLDIAQEFIKELEGLADGVVIDPIGWELKVPELLERIGR